MPDPEQVAATGCLAGGRKHQVTDKQGKPMSGRLCEHHFDTLSRILRDIEREAAPWQVTESDRRLTNLDLVPSMQIDWNSSGGALASELSPVRLNALVHRDTRHGLGDWEDEDDRHAAGHAVSVLVVLHAWADQVRRDHHLTRPTVTVRLGWLHARRGPVCGHPCGHDTCGTWVTDTITAQPTITGERNLLTRQLDWIAGQPWVGDMYADLRQLRDQLRRANGTNPDDPLPGRCPNLIDGTGMQRAPVAGQTPAHLRAGVDGWRPLSHPVLRVHPTVGRPVGAGPPGPHPGSPAAGQEHPHRHRRPVVAALRRLPGDARHEHRPLHRLQPVAHRPTHLHVPMPHRPRTPTRIHLPPPAADRLVLPRPQAVRAPATRPTRHRHRQHPPQEDHMTTEPDPAHILTDTWLIFHTHRHFVRVHPHHHLSPVHPRRLVPVPHRHVRRQPPGPAVHHVGRGLRTITGHGTWTAPPQGPAVTWASGPHPRRRRTVHRQRALAVGLWSRSRSPESVASSSRTGAPGDCPEADPHPNHRHPAPSSRGNGNHGSHRPPPHRCRSSAPASSPPGKTPANQ